MNNLQYGSGERNRYFSGKLMTARDFEREQTYFNDKRRLGNRLLHGAGVVSGLGVLLVDNQSFSLEAGMALDYLGREIVVRQSSVKRLSALKGFEDIQDSGDVYLGISYREEPRESTFTVAGQEGEVREEFNRVREDYELFLTTRKPDRSVLGVERVLYDLCPLYDGQGVSVTLRLPRFANVDDRFLVRVLFEKRDVSAPARFSFDLESDLFQGEEGRGIIHVEYVETEVTTNKHLALDYAMDCGPVRNDYTNVTVPADSFSLRVGTEEEKLEQSVTRPVEVTASPLRDVVTEAYYAFHFDELLSASEDQAIYLAKLHVIRGSSGYSIEELVRNPFRQYLPNVQLLDLLQGLEREGGRRAGRSEQKAAAGAPAPVPPRGREILTGVQTIQLGVAPKAGRAYYSHEFIHGLGPGSVCVVTAVESTPRLGDPSMLVFGKGSIFSEEKFSLAAPSCDTAAMVNTERGTLQLGVKLLEKPSQQSIRVRWWGWQAGDEGRKKETGGEIRVVVTPDTASLEPLQQLRFVAQVEGSASQEVNWTVVERDGGIIDRNGLYTAPAAEGVFEIQAQSVKYIDRRASAYIVVGRG